VIQENKEFASSFVSSLVKQLLKYMTCYKQPLVKMLYKKHKKYRWFSRFKEGQTSMEDEEYYG
jgi:hypothetical protein